MQTEQSSALGTMPGRKKFLMILMAHPSQLGFQDAASPVIEELIYFHDHTLMVVLLVSSVVFYILIAILTTRLTDKFIIDSQGVEVV